MTDYEEAESLLHYMRRLDIKEEMIYKRSAVDQMIFFRDGIVPLFQDRYPLELPLDERRKESEKRDHWCKVRGFHRSKSIELPVYWLKNERIELVARNNFYNWNVSIRSDKPLDLPDYFNINAGYSYLFLEGMEDTKSPEYSKDQEEYMKKFSFCVISNYGLFAVMWCIASQLETT